MCTLGHALLWVQEATMFLHTVGRALLGGCRPRSSRLRHSACNPPGGSSSPIAYEVGDRESACDARACGVGNPFDPWARRVAGAGATAVHDAGAGPPVHGHGGVQLPRRRAQDDPYV